jgi:hypothetical protein
MKNENKWGDMVQLRMAAESVADAINVCAPGSTTGSAPAARTPSC